MSIVKVFVFSQTSYPATATQSNAYSYHVVRKERIVKKVCESYKGYNVMQAHLYSTLQALKAGAEHAKEGDEIVIYVGDGYPVGVLGEMYHGWVANGWRTKTGAPVKNRELIEECMKHKKLARVVYFPKKYYDSEDYATAQMAQTALSHMALGIETSNSFVMDQNIVDDALFN